MLAPSPDALPPQPAPAARSPRLAGLALLVTLAHLATAHGYGYFRDELYYLDCGRHLSLGYVDHPPLVALIAAAVDATLGHSLLALRLVPALAAGALVWMTGALTAALSGRSYAQLLAGSAVGLAPVVVAVSSFYSMNVLDLLLWTAASTLFAGLLRAPSRRGWLTLGLVLGVGLENKLSILLLGLGLGLGLLVARRALLRTSGPYLALAVAAVLFAPHVAWQAWHGFPTLEFIHNARVEKMQVLSTGDFLLEQLKQQGPLSAPLWLAGLVWLFRARPYRPLAITSLTVLIVLLVTDGKPYYAAPAFAPLLAAGAVAFERALGTVARAGAVLLVVAGDLVLVPIVKPVLPVPLFLRYQAALGMEASTGERHARGVLPQLFADMHGWPELARAVADLHATLPASERARACVLTQNYGQAGAVDVLGPAGGPRALSGHNSHWLWGPGDCTGAVMLVIGGTRERLLEDFAEVAQRASHHCPLCMPYERDRALFVARGLRLPLPVWWQRLKHYR